MSLREKSITDKIEVVENGALQVRTANIVLRNGAEIARTFHRHVFAPGDDVTAESDRVQAVAAAVWTPAIIDAYKAQQSLTETDDENP